MANLDSKLRRTCLYEEHLTSGARFVPYAGWAMPVQYTGVVQEHTATRQSVGLFDVTHMGRLKLSGDEALSVVDSLIANDLKAAKVGAALYTCCCNREGMILDDLLVYRLSDTEIWVVCNAANRTKIANHFRAHSQNRCSFEDFSESTALIAVQGPQALEVMSQIGAPADLAHQLKKFHIAPGSVASTSCTWARTGYTGEDGVELFLPVERAPEVWRRLVEAASRVGGGPVGLAARDTLRLEARLSLYGNEIDESTHPFEAGLGWTVELSRGDFLGRDALVKLAAKTPVRVMVGFEMTGRGIARAGYPLLSPEGEELGVCTSGSPAPTLGKNIGLGYVSSSYAAIGSALVVNCRGRKISARVVKTPFYRRPRMPVSPGNNTHE